MRALRKLTNWIQGRKTRQRSNRAIEQALELLSYSRYRVCCKNESGEQTLLFFDSKVEDSKAFAVSLCDSLRHNTGDMTFFICSIEEMA